eukprot:gnl/TRDRNA2_/TRDRNA2_154309_c0_seq1.p1 gnl/TRDRNA2_/TRDRNA2_154309_c0~~gnl/TRDRNA2_/TRDRNA2_154309_c0_seq1.p1  ORF type:complete len:274 (-),score=63.64 gnl/TRDRNA2_/TRDRNA2_154309_c0_seq1:36-857(-)
MEAAKVDMFTDAEMESIRAAVDSIEADLQRGSREEEHRDAAEYVDRERAEASVEVRQEGGREEQRGDLTSREKSTEISQGDSRENDEKPGTAIGSVSSDRNDTAFSEQRSSSPPIDFPPEGSQEMEEDEDRNRSVAPTLAAPVLPCEPGFLDAFREGMKVLAFLAPQPVEQEADAEVEQANLRKGPSQSEAAHIGESEVDPSPPPSAVQELALQHEALEQLVRDNHEQEVLAALVHDLSALPTEALRAACRTRGVPDQGPKEQLVEQLAALAC